MLLWSVTLQSVPCGCGSDTNQDPGKYVNRKYVNTWPCALWIIMPAYLSLISHGYQAIFEETFECSHSNKCPKKASSTNQSFPWSISSCLAVGNPGLHIHLCAPGPRLAAIAELLLPSPGSIMLTYSPAQLFEMTEEELYTTYKGVYLPKVVHFRESLKYYEEFSFHPDDILIVTYPKSGTTWMQEIVPLIMSQGDPELVDTVPSWSRVPWLESGAFIHNLDQRPSPRVFITHFQYNMMSTGFLKVKPRVLSGTGRII
ncbi:uncharacterized protein LOC130406183 isoform X2 [Gadus chalcogrammus]|uniref:uncharacterized protein LOC130406183 isoform X2 n=1 Tax=Gadus chalcogrammus TaxID=1042646 RepID=UPI0024C49454|nr:uncharacterized protein LOC130406183 isoform X2 [Gadus chalcogrammus]